LESSRLQLQRLRLQDTKVAGALPSSFGQADDLLEIDLSRTLVGQSAYFIDVLTVFAFGAVQVSGDVPSTWSAMSSLRRLILRSTAISGSLPCVRLMRVLIFQLHCHR
jgi:hypothetical protein